MNVCMGWKNGKVRLIGFGEYETRLKEVEPEDWIILNVEAENSSSELADWLKKKGLNKIEILMLSMMMIDFFKELKEIRASGGSWKLRGSKGANYE